MQETETRDWRGLRVITRIWCNVCGQMHRDTGPAWEQWTVLPDGTRALSLQSWYRHGEPYREGGPACRRWYVAEDGTRVQTYEDWLQHLLLHRVDGPARRSWSMHGTDDSRSHHWHGEGIEEEELPWYRRSRGFLGSVSVTLAAGFRSRDGSPAWTQDPRLTSFSGVLYVSAVGGAVLLCV